MIEKEEKEEEEEEEGYFCTLFLLRIRALHCQDLQSQHQEGGRGASGS